MLEKDASSERGSENPHESPSEETLAVPPNPEGQVLNDSTLVKESPPDDPPPDGGLAWLQVVGSFFLFFNGWGIVNSFGVYQTYYSEALLNNQSPSNISWIGSIQSFLLLMIGGLTGPIFDAGYFNALVRTGSFLIVFGIMMTSICNQYWQVMLAQGVCIGLGSGCIFVPSVAILPQFFSSKKALATGISASGSSLGGIIYPILFYKLQPMIGFGWATRVIGFMALALLSISMSVMRVRVFPKEKRALFDLSAWKEPTFVFFTAAFFFGFVGLYTPIFYVQTYGIQEGITNKTLGFYLLPILNAGSIFGRILPNFFADYTGPLNMLIPCSFAAAILNFGWIGIKDVAGLIVFSLLYGFSSGTYVSLPPTVLVSLTPHLGVVGTRIGMSFAVSSLGLLIGTPVSGAILNSTKQWFGAQLMSAVCVLLSTICLIIARTTQYGAKIRVQA